MSVMRRGRDAVHALANMDRWLVLVTAALCGVGLLFVHSSTHADPDDADLFQRQTVFLLASAVAALMLVMVPYARIMRLAWPLYGLSLLSLLLLPFVGIMVNGARRWYRLPGFSLQPSEFAKLAVIIGLAAWFRFRDRKSITASVVLPLMIAGVPALLVMKQPDLGSSLVFWPVVFAMCYAAGTSVRRLALVALCGAVAMSGLWFGLKEYQRQRIDVWVSHFAWGDDVDGPAPPAEVSADRFAGSGKVMDAAARKESEDKRKAEAKERRKTQALLRGPAYQPWQSLIAIGSGGWTGAGVGAGPQSQFDYLPYRHADYLFSVVAEETGLLGVAGLLLLQALLVLRILVLAARSRERFGRLVCVGVATWIGAQGLMHIAVCAWFVPATGLPLPLLSYGGSSTLSAMLGLGLVLGISGRREPVLGADGYA